jgi:hypothetical protein
MGQAETGWVWGKVWSKLGEVEYELVVCQGVLMWFVVRLHRVGVSSRRHHKFHSRSKHLPYSLGVTCSRQNGSLRGAEDEDPCWQGKWMDEEGGKRPKWGMVMSNGLVIALP